MKILIVDDNLENRYLLESLLKGNGYEAQTAVNGAEALDLLTNSNFDLIISDILMPVMDGFELCRKVRADEKLRHIPFIIYTATYTGPLDEAFALKIGADRFIIKPCEPDIFIEAIHDVMSTDKRGNITAINEEPQEEEILKLYNERLVRKLEQKMLELEKEVQARSETEKTLKQSENRYRSLYNSIRDAIIIADTEIRMIDCNRAFIDLFGYTFEEISGKNSLLIYENENEFRRLGNALREHTGDSSFLYAVNLKKKDGTVFPGEVGIFYLRTDEGELAGFIGLIRDVTEKKQADTIQRNLEAQLYQAQKMESIGRLAGGIAHDFNNLLSVILMYGNIAMESLGKDHPQYEKLNQIYQAGIRAGNLTRQLLAFSRNQVLEIKTIDVNAVVTGFEKLIRHMIGEDIQMRLILDSAPLTVKADITQLEQVLMNLAVNARDAMPDGGTLTIETMGIELNGAFIEKTPNIKAGNYAMILVSDTGCGMDIETQEQIFEPFYTTKEADKGTGLGLATSYGIIKQHGGNIFVSSEPGKGTAFTIYLPLCVELNEPPKNYRKVQNLRSGSKTILVVEDDPSLRNLISKILMEHGFTAILSETASDAIEKAKGYQHSIHLVLSDVVMPGMKGPEVFNRILEHHPEAKALYMSGYTDNIIISNGLRKDDIQFIQKPFTVNALLEKCSQVLRDK
ncbi:MAG: hypothetical protein CVV44_14795 [Spirochaetae bacterium HGW-Spirochaetae-1]|jgi:PAS domain S-box-containing protein|nr:MAG: hypothetical protein CVV44_14795 [Spirochaetae bacterium HGW-Spirochaetae-1]